MRITNFTGGALTVQYRANKAKGQICGDTGVKLQGIPHLNPKAMKRLSKPKKTVARPYGGSRSGEAVKTR